MRAASTTLALSFLALSLPLPNSGMAQDLPSPERAQPENRVLTHREQAPIVRARIVKRFETVLPELMRREGIDLWLIDTREYNNDPVFESMAPLTTYSSRRRTILVFHDRGEGLGVERLSIGRSDYDGLFDVVRTHNDGQYEGLRQVIRDRDPQTIGINVSQYWNHADGLTANERDNIVEALGPEYASRLTSAEMLAVGWLEVKLPEETDQYRYVMRIAHQVIAEAFSNRVIVPGVTTTEDVRWWMRQRVAELGLGQWFHPSVNVQRRGGAEAGPAGVVIQRGDMLHCDFGIVHLGYSTDTQHNAYVLRHGETDAPTGLKAGLAAANRLQDLNMEYAEVGRTGNEALAGALAQARREGLIATIYSHPIGYHGHAAGPPIGMTDYQDGVPVRGDAVLRQYLAVDRAQREASGTRVGRPGSALRSGGGRRSHRKRMGVDRRATEGVLPDPMSSVLEGSVTSASTVELVHFTGCPNADTAREHVRQALAAVGRANSWVEWDLEDLTTPERYRAYGSPTVLVRGRDVTDAPVSSVGLSCSAGGAPSVQQIVEALVP